MKIQEHIKIDKHQMNANSSIQQGFATILKSPTKYHLTKRTTNGACGPFYRNQHQQTQNPNPKPKFKNPKTQELVSTTQHHTKNNDSDCTRTSRRPSWLTRSCDLPNQALSHIRTGQTEPLGKPGICINTNIENPACHFPLNQLTS